MLQPTSTTPVPSAPQSSRVARHPLAEQYGGLLRQLRNRPDRTLVNKLIGLTSVRRGAGVTTVTLNLAWRAVSESLSVLVVDLNRSHQDAMVQLGGRRKSPGLLDFAHAEIDLEDCLQAATQNERLRMMTCGRLAGPVRPEVAQHVLGQLSERFDLVLFDLPPVIEPGPWQGFAPCIDALMLVLEADRENRRELHEAKRRLTESGVEITGVIWNKDRA